MFDSVVEAIAYHAEHTGDQMAVITESSQICYEELWRQIQQYAAVLSKRGIMGGDRVVLAADCSDVFVGAYFAVHWLGAVSVVVEKKSTLLTISNQLCKLSPKLAFLHHKEQDANMYDILDIVDNGTWDIPKKGFTPESLADILFTTGTTGEPKGVMLSHRNEVAGALNVISGGGMTREDRNLLTMPLHHAFGLTTLRAVMYMGGTAVLQDGVASLKKMHHNISKNSCNSIYMVPSALRVLYFQTGKRLDLLLGNVEKIEFCTAPLDKKMRCVLMEQLKGVRLYNSYGATESARTVYMRLDKNGDRMDSIGQAVDNVSIWIVDDECKKMDSSREHFGHLAIRGAMNMMGYYGDPCMTEKVLADDVFYSEDLGYIDKEGYIYLLGRENDVIHIGGEKVSPFEIENLALEYKGVQECACVGVRDPREILGDVSILYVVEETGSSLAVNQLQSFLKAHLEAYKVPYKIIVLKEIPKNHMGKIDRNTLCDLWRETYGENDK